MCLFFFFKHKVIILFVKDFFFLFHHQLVSNKTRPPRTARLTKFMQMQHGWCFACSSANFIIYTFYLFIYFLAFPFFFHSDRFLLSVWMINTVVFDHMLSQCLYLLLHKSRMWRMWRVLVWSGEKFPLWGKRLFCRNKQTNKKNALKLHVWFFLMTFKHHESAQWGFKSSARVSDVCGGNISSTPSTPWVSHKKKKKKKC